jgi:hypothetical protein
MTRFLQGSRAALLMLCSACACVNAATVSGHITDAKTASPVADASINGPYDPFSGHYEFATTTDTNGYYQLALETGTFPISIAATGYLQLQTQLEVSGDPTTADFALTAATSVTGTVRADGIGIAKRVNVYAADQQTLVDWDSSNDDGTYAFNALPADKYAVCVEDVGDEYLSQCYDELDADASGVRKYTAIDLSAGGAATGIDFDLHVGSAVTGTLHDSYFAVPIANAIVELTLYSSGELPISTTRTTTDEFGQYLIGGVAPGSYYLVADGPADPPAPNAYYVPTLHAGGECPGGDPPCPFTAQALFVVPANGSATAIDATLRPGHVITGTVTDAKSGLPLSGVQVNSCEQAGFLYMLAGTATTVADGTYTLAHLTGRGSGEYLFTTNSLGYVNIVWPNAPLYGNWSCAWNQPLTFAAPNQNLSGVDFALTPSASISGSVTATEVPNRGVPATVEVWADLGGGVLSLDWQGSTDDSGDYRATVAAGTHYVVAYFPLYEECQVYSVSPCADPATYGGIDPAQATPITVVDGDVENGIDLTLQVEIFHGAFE